VLAYVLARDMMVGWIRSPSPAEKEFLAAPARDLPETGRLTGRGDTVSLERLVAAKPDLVLDFGSTTETYVSLADRVQSQTGIPYVLIDGRFTATLPSLKLAADILGRAQRGAELASFAEKSFAAVDEVLARVPADKRPRVYLARGRKGSRPARVARSIPRSSSGPGRSMSPKVWAAAAISPMPRWNKSSPGTRHHRHHGPRFSSRE